jgi:hypothetical protein
VPDKPTLDEIRARLANHTQVLAHRHYAQDVGVLLEMVAAYDAALALASALLNTKDARIAELESKLAEMVDGFETRHAALIFAAGDRDRIIAYARKLNYGPTLRTFIKYITREYHVTWGKDGRPVDG